MKRAAVRITAFLLTLTAITTGTGFSAEVLRFKRIRINDRSDMIGGEAFSFLAPVNWQKDGGIVWRLHPAMPAAVSLRVFDPKSMDQIETFPTVAFSWGGYLGPGTIFPPGANYLGNEVQPPTGHAIQYLKERHLPRMRGGKQCRIVAEQELPDLARAAAQAEPTPPYGGPQLKFTAGKIRIQYEISSKTVEEDLSCVLNTMRLPTVNMVIEIADKLYGLRSEKGKLDNQTRLFQTIMNSTRLDLKWFNRYSQLCQALTQAQMNQIRAAGELSRYISRTSSEISDMMRQSYEERQASQDRMNKNWSQYMRGVDEYRDPVTGSNVELPSGYNKAWVNGQGEYIVTDRVNYNPNVDLGGDWTELKKSPE